MTRRVPQTAITLPVERKLIFCARFGEEDEHVFIEAEFEFDRNGFPYGYSGGALEVVAVIIWLIVVVWHNIRIQTVDLYHLLTEVLGQPDGNLA